MVLWLLQHVLPLFQQVELHTSGNSRVYLTSRIAMASVTSFLFAILLGPIAISWLKKRFREKVSSASPTLDQLHQSKNNTPTMGGLFIVSAIVLSLLIWGNLENHYVHLGLFITLSFAMLGAVDDWRKMNSNTKGLSAKTKFAIQWLLAIMAASPLYLHQLKIPYGVDLIFPIGNLVIPIGIGFILWAAFILVATSNGVNLTDGLDGLAAGCTIFAASALIALSYLAGHSILAEYLAIPYIPGVGEVGVLLGSLIGAMLGFLWYNCYPAQVFMGDTGSLPTGAILGFCAIVTRQEFLLIIIGGIFVVETLSVIIQIGNYRLTGKRILKCSPLHNHFILSGDHEIKVVVRFWITAALLAILALVSLKIQ